jgi:DNA-binding HxlR family transcriptional regulator
VHDDPGDELGTRHQGQWTPLARALSATGDRWTLSIALALVREDTQRPVQVRRRLAGISTGVLDRHLQRMVTQGLLSRERYREMPPRVELALTEAGRELQPIVAALARWGMRHMWSAPRARERVDVEALLELLPMLLADPVPTRDGTLELAVGDPERPPATRRFALERGRLRALEADGEKPAASVVGDTPAWIAALGPRRDYARLRFSGRRTLAREVLEALPAPAATDEIRKATTDGRP